MREVVVVVKCHYLDFRPETAHVLKERQWVCDPYNHKNGIRWSELRQYRDISFSGLFWEQRAGW